jgi:probable phosphoglycerate mutase
MPKTHPSQGTELVAYIDGASRGNPGPAAYAVVVESTEGASLAAFSKFLGRASNNVAEYQALLAALDYGLEHHHRRLRVLSDSELLVRQILGSYKVKSPDLKPLHEKARQTIARLEAFTIQHVPREKNREADRLANLALDAAEVGTGFKPAPGVPPPPLSEVLRASATFRRGIFKPHRDLPLTEGEEVELEIRRKK